MQIKTLHVYRAILGPEETLADLLEVRADEGALPSIRLKARNNTLTALAAHHITARPVLRVERIDEAKAVAA